VSYFVALPLILTFSRREKEQPLVSFVKPVGLKAESSFCFAKTLGAFLPLPAGEGRGEGEHSANINGYNFANSVIIFGGVSVLAS
jgi:hypothetical protein